MKFQLKLFNFLTRRKEIFKSLKKDKVGIYTCGPTVYNFAHIGNLRTYIFEDILRRTLEFAGYRVLHIMNITDVDDKIIREAEKSAKSIFEYVKPYEKAFFEDLEKLNIKKAHRYPKATKHIKEMISLVERLLKKGLAYRAGGSVYFDISKFKSYGKLNKLKLKELKSGDRVSADEYSKNDVKDFVLWKGRHVASEPSWKAPFGAGRPGWHLECSVMSMKYLGSTFDIHAGGVDLLFPHHENEIAQSEGATGKRFVRFFVEAEHLLVEGEKMSKSLGNIFTLRDLEKRGFAPLAFRYLVLTAHYRSKLNFTWQSLEAAQNSLERLYEFVRDIKLKPSLPHPKRGIASVVEKRFKNAIFNDLDTPKALAVLWEMINSYHKNPSRYDTRRVLALLYEFDKIFGLGLEDIKPVKIPAAIQRLVQKRERYRKLKKWEAADKIREEIKNKGWSVEDMPGGPKLKKI